MTRFCISLPDDIHEKLKSNAKEQHISIAHYIRKLIEMGLEIENLTGKNKGDAGDNTSIFSEEKQRALWKNLMSWSLESRLLTRVLFGKILEGKYPDVDAEIKSIKDKATAHALGILDMSED